MAPTGARALDRRGSLSPVGARHPSSRAFPTPARQHPQDISRCHDGHLPPRPGDGRAAGPGVRRGTARQGHGTSSTELLIL